MSTKKKEFLLYKIYSENGLLYLGRTNQPLDRRLYGHFFRKPMHREINIECVTRIEYALFPTQADQYLYEIYYINMLKPPLNRDDKARDHLTVSLPHVHFQEYECRLLGKWKQEIREQDRQDELRQSRLRKIEIERREKRKEIYMREDITPEQKQDLFTNWLLNYYEPVRNAMI